MTRGRKLWIGFLVALLLAGTLIGGRGGGGGDAGPGGTLALRRMLAALGADVRLADEPPLPPATFVLVADFRDIDGVAELTAWVGAGGRLVVADPESLVTAQAGIAETGRVGTIGDAKLTPGCAAPAAAGVRSIVVPGGAPLLGGPDPSAIGCFPASGGSFVVSSPEGDGEIVVLGDPAPLTNEFLRRDDNAVLAVNVLAGRGPVVFGPALPAGAGSSAPAGLWPSLPGAARAVVVQVVLALVLFALVRARRMGAVVEETPVAPIPAGELIRATGRLLRSARASAHAARLMRRHAARHLTARLGDVPRAVAASRDSVRIERVFEGPEPSRDDELIGLARDIEETRRTLEGAGS